MNCKNALQKHIFKIISQASEELDIQSYVIGGFVRDFILERGTHKDIDVVTVGSGIELAQKVSSLLPDKPRFKCLKPMELRCFVLKM